MNERKRTLRNDSEIVRPPTFPIPGHKIFERVGTAVSTARGYTLEKVDFARLIGKSKSTTSYWFGVFSQPHLVACFCLLEQLLPEDRHRVVDGLCRELPLFEHPRLRHNPIAITVLRNLLGQSKGLTLIEGGTDEQRTFLITAIGHNFCRVDRRHRTAVGVDLHEPDWFVPIETVFYLKGPAEVARVRELVRNNWAEIVCTNSPLILMNRVWSIVPDLRKDILRLAKQRHVVIAEQQITDPRTTFSKQQPFSILSVSSVRGSAGCISVEAIRG